MADPKLRIEFDMSEAESGIGRLRQMLDDIGGRRGTGDGSGTGRSSGGGGGDRGGRSADDRAAEAIGRNFQSLIMGQITGNLSTAVASAFNPLRTAFQQNEILTRAGAEAAGAAAGFAGAAALPHDVADPGARAARTQLGAQLGQSAARVGVEAILQQPEVARERYVNERVSESLQAEGRARAAVGASFSKDDAAAMGKELARAFRVEFDNMRAGVQGADASTMGLGEAIGGAINQRFNDLAKNIAGGPGAVPFLKSLGRDEGG